MGHNRWINEELTGYDILKSFLNTYSGVKAKGFQAVLNKEADSTPSRWSIYTDYPTLLSITVKVLVMVQDQHVTVP